MHDSEKIKLLVSVAKLYYLENKNQSEIANIYGVSRPLISKYLQDAKNLGIVKIEINEMQNTNDYDERIEQICKKYNLKKFISVSSSTNKDLNEQLFADYIIEFALNNHGENMLGGIGWGSTIGNSVERLEKMERNKLKGDIIPLISNAPVPLKNYHPNELARMLSEKTGLKAKYIYSPVICSSQEEKDFFLQTAPAKKMFELYNKLDYAFIQIKNFPAVPDLATEARFGKKLIENHAIGNFLGYYYDIDGNFFSSHLDYSIMISLRDLRKIDNAIALVNSRVNVNALLGALRSQMFDVFIVSEVVVNELLKLEDI